MKAYSLHDREVGYCQGTAFIVGLLLMQVSKVTRSHSQRSRLGSYTESR